MDREKVIETILLILKQKLYIKYNEKAEQIEYLPLLGSAFGLKPYELAYLVMEVKKEFKIDIPSSYLIIPGIKTIDDFTRIIL